MNSEKEKIAVETPHRTLAQAFQDAGYRTAAFAAKEMLKRGMVA